jgi:nucleotide-binding universal stress UspA family protein
MDIKNVLVPMDFSPASRLALNWGVSLARSLRAKLTLMHVVEFPSVLRHPFGQESSEIEKKHHDQTMRMLSCLVAPEDQDDLDLQIVIKSGDIKKEIAEVIDEQRADVVVMGTHGRGLFGRWLIGSITEGLLRKVTIPVLTVCRARSALGVKRILFATDLSESTKQGFDFALDLARTMESDLVLAHVVNTAVSYADVEVLSDAGDMIENAEKELQQFATQARNADVNIQTFVLEGNVAEEILNTADRYCADLILITVQSKPFVERALLGTTAERVIREAKVPVFLIPVQQAQEGRRTA